MKKLLFIPVLALLAGTLRAQTTDDLAQTDNAISTLAVELAQKLAAERVQTVTIGQFGGSPQFNAYIKNQLFGELTDRPGRSFTLVSAGSAAQWTISGEIVRIGNMMRMYTRLMRRADNTVVSQIRTDLELNRGLRAMLSSSNDDDDSEMMVFSDALEPDSRETPVTFSLGDNETVMRTIQAGDNDWFLIESANAAVLVLETTGSMDTRMTLYDADTYEELDSDDDGGDGTNASIRRFTQPGRRYLVKVSGYSSDTTGEYGFRAYTEEMGDPIRYEPIGDINTSQFMTRRLTDNGDLFLLVAPTSGTMVIETTGQEDVVMELYDAETYDMLQEDDDSGHDNNARIVREVERGERFLAKVRPYSSSDGARYGFKAYMDDTAAEYVEDKAAEYVEDTDIRFLPY